MESRLNIYRVNLVFFLKAYGVLVEAMGIE